MKLQFVSYDNIDIIKSNLKSWVDNFKQDSSDWLQDELGNALFSDTKFAEIPDFSLDMSADKPLTLRIKSALRSPRGYAASAEAYSMFATCTGFA